MTDRHKNIPHQRAEDISTLRLKLRTVKLSDTSALRRLWTDKLVRKHLGGPISPAKAKKRAKEIIGKAGYL